MKNSTLLVAVLVSFGLLAQSLVGCGGRTQVVSSDDAAGDKTNLAEQKKAKPGGAKTEGHKPGSREGKGSGDADPSGEGFALPQDQGGKILARELPPHRNAPPPPAGVGTRPRRLRAGGNLETPELPLPPGQAELPPPLDTADPKAPAPRKLPEARRIRLPAVDVDDPLPLPVLGQALPDRAPLTDPTADISRKAAVAASVAARATPFPFLRINLPDPFEHKQVIRLRKPPAEGLPKNAGSQPPAKGGK
jgi:hypothetical protein